MDRTPKRKSKIPIGKRYGMLTLVSVEGHDNYGYIWKCLCDCGTELLVKHRQLIHSSHPKTHCGCQNQNRRHPNWKGCGLLSGNHWYSIQKAARDRGLPVEITIQEAWDLYEQQDGLCAYTSLPLQFATSKRTHGWASLDRIDSASGYISGNIQWVHKIVNRMKLDLPEELFLLIVKMIHEHRCKDLSELGEVDWMSVARRLYR